MGERMIPFGEWLPDQPDHMNQGLITATNVIPANYKALTPEQQEELGSLDDLLVNYSDKLEDVDDSINFVRSNTDGSDPRRGSVSSVSSDDSYATAQESSDEEPFTDAVPHQGMQVQRGKVTIEDITANAKERGEVARRLEQIEQFKAAANEEDDYVMVPLNQRTDLTPATARRDAALFRKNLQKKREQEEEKRRQEKAKKLSKLFNKRTTPGST